MFQEAAASWMDGPPSGTALVSSPAPASASVGPLLQEPTAVCADLEPRVQVVYTTALWDVCEHPDFKDQVTRPSPTPPQAMSRGMLCKGQMCSLEDS